MTVPLEFTNSLTKYFGEPLSGDLQAGGTKGIVEKLKIEIFYAIYFQDIFYNISPSTFLDKNKGTSYVELELFTTKLSSNYLTIFDVQLNGLKYEKNEKLIGRKVSFEMNRFKDQFNLSTEISNDKIQSKCIRVALSSTHPSVQHVSSKHKSHFFSTPKMCQFNTTKASVQ